MFVWDYNHKMQRSFMAIKNKNLHAELLTRTTSGMGIVYPTDDPILEQMVRGCTEEGKTRSARCENNRSLSTTSITWGTSFGVLFDHGYDLHVVLGRPFFGWYSRFIANHSFYHQCCTKSGCLSVEISHEVSSIVNVDCRIVFHANFELSYVI